MAYTVTTPLAGIPTIASVAGTPALPLGTQVQATDPVFGEGSFLYLCAASSVIAGALVSYNQLTGRVTNVPNTANLGAPLAVAMTATPAVAVPTYGWFQVRGAAVIKKTAVKVNPAVKLYISATAGRVMSTAASGKQVLEMISINAATVASATSTITALIAYPVAQGATA